MSKPRENVFGVDYGEFNCASKEQANRIADRLATYVRRQINVDAIVIIALSNLDQSRATVTVKGNNSKVIVPHSEKPYAKPWHIHVSLLAKPGNAVATGFGEYMVRALKGEPYAWVERDVEGVGKHTRNRIPYILRQSVILRALEVGGVTRLELAEKYLDVGKKEARNRGDQRLKIF